MARRQSRPQPAYIEALARRVLRLYREAEPAMTPMQRLTWIGCGNFRLFIDRATAEWPFDDCNMRTAIVLNHCMFHVVIRGLSIKEALKVKVGRGRGRF